MTKLRLEDGLSIGFCVRGQRRFCQQHGLDFWRLAREGLIVEELEHIDDSALQQCLEVARKRESAGGQG